jgi:hypothetical protein
MTSESMRYRGQWRKDGQDDQHGDQGSRSSSPRDFNRHAVEQAVGFKAEVASACESVTALGSSLQELRSCVNFLTIKKDSFEKAASDLMEIKDQLAAFLGRKDGDCPSRESRNWKELSI